MSRIRWSLLGSPNDSKDNPLVRSDRLHGILLRDNRLARECAMTIANEALLATLERAAVGPVRAATADDRVAGVQPTVVTAPTTAEDVAALLTYANSEQLKVLVRGGGTQLHLGHPPTGGEILLDMRGLDRLVEHEPGDMTATVEAGMRLVDFQAALSKAGQWLALDPALPAEATIGGVVATAVSGPRRLRYGGVRDQIIGVHVARADGTLAKGGGKVVKNVAGFDLPKLFTGSLGTLGVIVSATFRLYPYAASSATAILAPGDEAAICDLAVKLLATTLVPSAIDLVGQVGTRAATLTVRFEGSAEATAEQVAAVVREAGPLGANATTLIGEAEADYWRAAAAGPLADLAAENVVRLKVSLLPTTVRDWLATAHERAGRLNLTGNWRVHAGHGLLDVGFAGTPESLRAIVADLRTAAVAQGGSLVVTDAPPALLATLDPWGSSPALALMQRVKAQFDPHNTLNPGRYVGGI